MRAVKEYHLNVPAMSSKELLKGTHEDNGEEDDSATGRRGGDEEMEEEQEQSEEEEETEEARNDFWQIDYAGDQADDPSNDGCLWMWVLWRLGNGRSGRHAVEGMRYPNFADMWGFIMREPAKIVPFEGLCRMEAAAGLRPALLAHEWYGEVSHWTDGAEAEDRTQQHAMEPGFASSSRESDQQKVAAQRWLRRQVNEKAKRRLREEVQPISNKCSLYQTSPIENRECMYPITRARPLKTSGPADVPINVKLPLDTGKEDDSATEGEEGYDEDEEEKEDSATGGEEGDEEEEAETEKEEEENEIDEIGR